ncbi:flagellar basal body-associated protein FliL [Planctomycetota bacterium]
MAEKEEEKQQNTPEDSKEEKNSKKSKIGRFLPWIIIVVVMAFCAGTGFGLGKILGGQDSNVEPDSEAVEIDLSQELAADIDSTKDSGNYWYYELDPVIGNLNEPRVSRFVSVSITLQISKNIDEKKCTTLLDENKPILTNWLTVYLMGLSLDDIRGDENIKKIQINILDAFNEKLFSDSQLKIENILFRAIAIQ